VPITLDSFLAMTARRLSASVTVTATPTAPVTVTVTVTVAPITVSVTIAVAPITVSVSIAVTPITVSVAVPTASVPAAPLPTALPSAPTPLARLIARGRLLTVLSVLGLSAPATPSATLGAGLAVLVVVVELGEDRLVIIVFLWENLRARQLLDRLLFFFECHFRTLLGLCRMGQLVVVTRLFLSGVQDLVGKLPEAEDPRLHFEDRSVTPILLHHGREARAHGALGGLADVTEQISLDGDLCDLLVMEGLADEAEHLHGRFGEGHVCRFARASLSNEDARCECGRVGAGWRARTPRWGNRGLQ
jgi:hypothetical protein